MEDLADKLAKTKYHYVHKRIRSPLYQYFLFEGISRHHNTNIKFPYEIPILHIDGDLAFTDSEFQKLKELTQKELEKNPHFMLDLLKDAYEINDHVESFAKELEKQDYSKVSKEDLGIYWKKYVAWLYQFGAYVAPPIFIEEYMENRLKEEIAKVFNQSEQAKVFQVLTTPMKVSIVQKEEENLLLLAIKKSKGEDILNDLAHHLAQYSWIKNNKFDGKFYNKEEILERIDRLKKENPQKKYEEYIAKIKGTQDQFNQYIASFNDTDVVSLINTLQEAIYFRSWRTERYYRNALFMQAFFKKTAQVLGLSEDLDLFYFTSEEILGAFEGVSLPVDKIQERKEGYVMFGDTKTIVICSGKEADSFRKMVNINQIETKNEIKGQVAYPGIAKGTARIVLSMTELNKVKEGDVLVTTSTTPDYIPVLKKVVAIVTEEGGVLSHASVISRELHIPCVIGTKVATKILKDGDIVEVDAEKGIVRIIT